MIEWFTWTHLVVAIVAGILGVVLGLAGRKPDDVTMGATLLVELLLLGQLVVTIAVSAAGTVPSGSTLEFWVYLVSAIFVPPLAVLWGLLDRSRWSTVVLGVACLAVAVMVYRMHEIWFVQVG